MSKHNKQGTGFLRRGRERKQAKPTEHAPLRDERILSRGAFVKKPTPAFKELTR